MALIKCPGGCGHDVSPNAPMCPHCGTKVAPDKCVVHFERRKNALMGIAVTGVVLVDGVVVGPASNGSAFDVELDYGVHNIGFDSTIGGMTVTGRTSLERLEIPVGARRVNVFMCVKQDATSFFSGVTKLGIESVQIIR